ncbi:hypothetical protein D3C73_1019080 [compost metagenome]
MAHHVRALLLTDLVGRFDQIVGHCDELLADGAVLPFDQETNFVVRIIRTAGLLFDRPAPGELGAVSDLPVFAIDPEVVVRTFFGQVGTVFLRLGMHRLFTASGFFTTRWLAGRFRFRTCTGPAGALGARLLTFFAFEDRALRLRTGRRTATEHAVAGALIPWLFPVAPQATTATAEAAAAFVGEHAAASTTTEPTIATAAATVPARQAVEDFLPLRAGTFHLVVDVVRGRVGQFTVGQTEVTHVSIDHHDHDVAHQGFRFTVATGATDFAVSNGGNDIDQVLHVVVVPPALAHQAGVLFTQRVVGGTVLDIVDGAVVYEVDKIAHDDSSWILNALNKALYTA